jgi:hypothetical protein
LLLPFGLLIRYSIFTTSAKIAHAGIKFKDIQAGRFVFVFQRQPVLEFLPGYALLVAYMGKMEWRVQQEDRWYGLMPQMHR